MVKKLKVGKSIFSISTVFALILLGCCVSAADIEWVTADRIGNPNADITLRLWITPDQSISSPIKAVSSHWEETYKSWAIKHPNVKLEVTIMPVSGDIAPQMMKAIRALEVGKGPDILLIDPFTRSMFFGTEILHPLDDYLTENEKNDFFPFIKDMLTYEGHFLLLPTDADCRALYYRKDLVPEPPRTWDELIEVASRIAKEKNISGFLYNGGRWEGTTVDALGYFWAQGGKLVDEKGNFVFLEGENKKYLLNILKFFRRTVESGASPKWVSTINDYSQFNAQAVAGNVAMFIGGNWQYAQLQEMLPPEEFEKWDVAEYPQPEADMYGTSASGWCVGITTHEPEKVNIAFNFLWDNYVSFEGVGNRCIVSGHLAPRKSVYEKYYHFRADRWMNKFGKILEHAGAQPGFKGYPEFSEQFQIAVGKVLTGATSPEAALETLIENMKAYKAEEK